MDDLQEALTRYMVRRVSSRKIRDRNGDLNLTKEDSQRKYQLSGGRESSTSMENHRPCDQTDYFSIKKANSTQNSCNNNNNNNNEKVFDSYNEYERSIEKLSISPKVDSSACTAEPFELSNPKLWSKPCEDVVNKNSNNSKKIHDIRSKNMISALEDSKLTDEPVQLLKVREIDIETPSKMMSELKNIKIAENRPFLENISHDLTQSSTTSLTEAIENLDIQIKNLEMRDTVKTTFTTTALVEDSARIYPVLDDVKFCPTGYTPRRNVYSQSKYYIEPDKVAQSRDNNSKKNSSKFTKLPNERIAPTEENWLDKDCGNFGNSKNRAERVNEASSKDESSKNDEVSIDKKNKSIENVLVYEETPRSTRKMPIMESTRKSLHSDSTKIKFPTPSRVDPNSISTIGVSGYTETSKSNQIGDSDIFNETIPYEVEHFLEDALGDEILNSTNMTYATCEARDRTNSHFTASELISHDRTPLHRRIMQALKPPMTEPTYKHCSTLDRSMEMYRSFSQTLKKKFRSGLSNKAEENRPVAQTLTTGINETDKIRELLHEVNVQQTLMNQATKALNLCNSMKEFVDSPERIESERLLLLANLRKKCVVEEIKQITSEEVKHEKNFDGQRGEITLSDMSLNLRESVKRETVENETIEWFVLIVSQGFKVWATQPINYQTRDRKISFTDKISIPNLTPGFKIHVEVYTMRVRKSMYNHEEKYRIRKSERRRRSTSCPPCPNILVSPTKLLKKAEGPCSSPKIHYGHGLRNKSSSFVLSGFVELFLHDLSLFSPWPLMLVPANSILQGTIDLNIACRLHLSVSHEGFVNHGDEAGGFAIWNRRWCILKGHTLLFWNYPHEQETKDPLKIVDLINCVSSKITTADRTICAKPRTLLFETARPKCSSDQDSMIVECTNACTIVRNLISLDSVKELMEWSTKLNHVIMALREWNVIHVRNQLQVSDL